MTRVLRGAWSRRGALTTLVLMTTVVVGGAVGVLGFAGAAGTSPVLTAPLLLIGAVAVPSIGAELAIARREEIGLARLRGIHGLRLWRFLLAEPLMAILVGLAAGVALGVGLTVVLVKAWLGESAPAFESRTFLVAAAIAGVGLLIVALGAGAALREPLATQVAMRRRPRRATTLAVFASLLVIIGAAVAVYRSRQPADGNDLLVLAGPALVGLAFGQGAIWLLRLGARTFTGTTSARGLGAFLATRRLARADDLVTPIRLVVAAAVVGGLALTGSVAVDDWTDTQARQVTGGPMVIDVDTGAAQARHLTRELDPEGTHLMASAVVPNDFRLAERRAYVDASRWEAVVGDFYAGTALAPASQAVPRLAAADEETAVGTATRFTVEATALRKSAQPTGVTVQVTYTTADDSVGTAEVSVGLPTRGSRGSGSTRVSDCAEPCTVTGLSVTRTGRPLGDFVFDTSLFVVLLERIDLGEVDLLDQVWRPDPAAIESYQNARWAPDIDPGDRLTINRPDGLQVTPLPDGPFALLTEAALEPLPVLATGAQQPLALDLSGDDRPVEVRGVATVLPLVGAVGTLADIRSASQASGPSVPSAEVRIVAAPDTPAALLDRTAEATGGEWRQLDDVRRDLGSAHGGDQARAYALTALACALVALLALAAGVARHLRDYRRDVASLRVLGVGLGTARRAGRTELVALTALVVAAVVAGSWAAVRLLLGGLPLVDLPAAALRVDTDPRLWPLLVPAALAGLAVVVIGGRARAVRATTTRPSLLREEEGA